MLRKIVTQQVDFHQIKTVEANNIIIFFKLKKVFDFGIFSIHFDGRKLNLGVTPII